MTTKRENAEAMLAAIRKRKEDYTLGDLQRERDELIALWKAAYPQCVEEPAAELHPLLMVWKHSPGTPKQDPLDPDERWSNDIYIVTVRRHAKDPVFGTGGGMVQIGINTQDGTTRHDWRCFQAIKNQIAGEECEAFELYPAQSRLLDPSNYFSLWCFPGLKRIKVGVEDYRVWDQNEAWAPQRRIAHPE